MPRNITKKYFVLSFLSIWALMVTVAVTPVQARDNVCFCHNVNHNPHTICTDNQGRINGHERHVERGSDTHGECPVTSPTPSPTRTVRYCHTNNSNDSEDHHENENEDDENDEHENEHDDCVPPPTVPEFGSLTGAITVLVSAGAFWKIKRKNNIN